MIAPFDLFGQKKYMYTFQMVCKEDPSIALNDGATRIFLNTHGTNPEDVSPELVELLHYIENTTQDMADSCSSSRIHKRQELKEEPREEKKVESLEKRKKEPLWHF